MDHLLGRALRAEQRLAIGDCDSGSPSAPICGTPALRKYLDTMMSVATCDHDAGISASAISKTTEPSGLVIRDVRFVHSTLANGS